MTSLLKGFVGTLSSALDFNQATLSGAIDIIVVEHEDGSQYSTPFHVRFGKLQLLRSREKVVSLRVNGEKAPFSMKLGRAGEAFFVEASTEPVEEEWTTSPIASPISSPSRSPSRKLSAIDVDQMRPALQEALEDLQEDSLLERSAEESSDMEEDVRACLLDVVRSIETRARLCEAILNATNEAEDVQVSDGALEDTLVRQSDDGAEQMWMWWSWGWGSFPVRNLSQTHLLHEEVFAEVNPAPPAPYCLESKVRTAVSDDDEKSPGTTSRSLLSQQRQLQSSPLPPPSSSWMSSIFGMFRRAAAPDSEEQRQEPDLVRVRVFVTRLGHVQVQLDLISSEYPSRSSSVTIPRLSETSAAAVSGPDTAAAVNSSSSSLVSFPPRLRWASSQPPLPTAPEPVAPPPAAPPQSLSETPNVEMSLCGTLLGPNALENAKHFREKAVDFNQLCMEPGLVFRPELVVRYHETLYPGRVALPLIMSYLTFGKALNDEALLKLAQTEDPRLEGIAVQHISKSKSSPVDESKSRPTTEVKELNEEKESGSFLYRWFVGGKQQEEKPSPQAEAQTHPQPQEPDVQIVKELESISDLKEAEMRFAENQPQSSLSMERVMFRKTLRPTSEMLRQLKLKPGPNLISFSVSSALQGTQTLEASIYLWRHNSRIVISDIDGTITRSDILGNIMPLMGKDWSHSGVTSLFSNIARNGYDILFLTSRAIGQANVTRDFLHSVRQGEESLPLGPLIMSPDSLIHSFKREVIYRRPQEFKIPALRDVSNLFPEPNRCFFAGFGNRHTDIESYKAVGVPSSKIFIIDPKGAVHHTQTLHQTSYPILNEKVEYMFPYYNPALRISIEPEFNEFNYWREGFVPLPVDDEEEELEGVLEEDDSLLDSSSDHKLEEIDIDVVVDEDVVTAS